MSSTSQDASVPGFARNLGGERDRRLHLVGTSYKKKTHVDKRPQRQSLFRPPLDSTRADVVNFQFGKVLLETKHMSIHALRCNRCFASLLWSIFNFGKVLHETKRMWLHMPTHEPSLPRPFCRSGNGPRRPKQRLHLAVMDQKGRMRSCVCRDASPACKTLLNWKLTSTRNSIRKGDD